MLGATQYAYESRRLLKELVQAFNFVFQDLLYIPGLPLGESNCVAFQVWKNDRGKFFIRLTQPRQFCNVRRVLKAELQLAAFIEERDLRDRPVWVQILAFSCVFSQYWVMQQRCGLRIQSTPEHRQFPAFQCCAIHG